ncbi:MAG: TlpA disulfide reductase family protein [Gammaproteobacteria bacterium]|nr:TlpA disulfide reductase family protein [Gammaproteobacteria bacterium]
MKRDLMLPLAVALVSMAAGFLLFRLTMQQPEFVSADPVSATPLTVDIAFEDIVLDDLQGQAQALTQWQAPVMVLNFWATWCAPCRREIPELIALQQEYPEQLQILGLAFDSVQNLQQFDGEFEFNYPSLVVGVETSQLNAYFGNDKSVLPFTVVLNQQRDIVYRHTGEITRQQLSEAIQPLL